MNNFDVIVIGAGNAGLSSATRLALAGKKVLVLEKHNIPGGCGTSFRRGRFEFEVALHQLSSMGTPEKPGPLRELFTEFGIVDRIDWIEIESLYNVNLPGAKNVALPADRKGAEAELIKKFPEEEKNIRAYYDMVWKFNEEITAFLAASAKSTGEPSSMKKAVMKAVFPSKYKTLAKYAVMSTQEVLDEFFDNKEIQLVLSAYWCFMGISPERFPFSILARCTHIYTEDKPFYLRGGSQVMSQALADRIRELGSELKFNCAAKKIIVENGKAVGVIDENGNEYRAKRVLSNISPVHTYMNLLDEDKIPQEARTNLKGYTVGISALTCFIGLDCTPEEIGFTESFNLTYDSLDANADFMDAYKLTADKDPIITTNYTVDDPEVSPKGTSIVTAGILKYATPWEELSPEEYHETKYRLADKIIERLETRYPGFRSHIEEMEVATPLTHMRYLNHPGGSIYGFEQDLKSSVFFYPQTSYIENLEFAGGWVNTCGFGPNYMYGDKIANIMLKDLEGDK